MVTLKRKKKVKCCRKKVMFPVEKRSVDVAAALFKQHEGTPIAAEGPEIMEGLEMLCATGTMGEYLTHSGL